MIFCPLLLVEEATASIELVRPLFFYLFIALSGVALLGLLFSAIYPIARDRRAPRKSVLLILSAVMGLTGCFAFLYGYSQYGNPTSSFIKAIEQTIRMYGFQMDLTDEIPALATINLDEPPAIAVFYLVFRIVEQVLCFAAAALAVLTSAIDMITAKLLNGTFVRRTSIIFTDISASELEDFLKRRRAEKDRIIIVVEAAGQLTQEGQELKALFNKKHYYVVAGSITAQYLRYRCKIRFYESSSKRVFGLFKDDEKNIAFAEAALGFIEKEKERSGSDKHIPNFYVSYQNSDMNFFMNFSSNSGGKIEFFSEYDWAATSFLFSNPLFRTYLHSRDGFTLTREPLHLEEEHRMHFHFLGFGNINKALLRKMIIQHRVPESWKIKNEAGRLVSPILYDVFDMALMGEEGEAIAKDFKSSFLAMSKEAFKNEEEYYKQDSIDDVNLFFHGTNLAADSEFDNYGESLVQQLTAEGSKDQFAVIIALGDSASNFYYASRLRDYVRTRLNSLAPLSPSFFSSKKDPFDLILKIQTEEGVDGHYKRLIIFPYIKGAKEYAPDRRDFLREVINLENLFEDKPTLPDYCRKKDEKLNTRVDYSQADELNYDNRRCYMYGVDSNSESLSLSFPKRSKVLRSYHRFRVLMKKRLKEGFKTYNECLNIKKPGPFAYLAFRAKSLSFHSFLYRLKEKQNALVNTMYKAEDLPIIAFGRGGYMPDEEWDFINALAKRCAFIYGGAEEIETPIGKLPIATAEEVDSKWAHISSSYVMESNFSLALSIPNKLLLLGYHISDFREVDKALLVGDIKETMDNLTLFYKEREKDINASLVGKSKPAALQEKIASSWDDLSLDPKKSYSVLLRIYLNHFFGTSFTSTSSLKEMEAFIPQTKQRELADMEHERWAAFSISLNNMPMHKKAFEELYLNEDHMPLIKTNEKGEKSVRFINKDRLREVNVCLCSCAGLCDVKNDYIKAISFAMDEFFKVKETDEKDATKLLSDALVWVFELVYWYDLFPLTEIGTEILTKVEKGEDFSLSPAFLLYKSKR